MKEKRNREIPGFKTLAEEREYWEARGPLAEGHKGTTNKPGPKQKRSSFLAVRLTGEELTKLRDLAAKQGFGPSTFARIVLTSAMEQKSQIKTLTLEQFISWFIKISPQITEKANDLFKRIAIGDSNNPAMLVIDGSQKKEFEEFSLLFIQTLLKLVGIQLVIPEKENYQEIKEIAKENINKEEIKV